MASTIEKVVTETRLKLSDATALGVFGLAMVTFVASSVKLGWVPGTHYVIPWAIMLGSIAQLWAAAIDMKNNSYFGSIVLGAYGLFWMAVAMHWMISQGWFYDIPADANPDLTKAVAFAYIGYLIFSLFITVAAWEANKVFGAILVLIDVLLLSLALQALKVGADFFGPLAAWSEFLIALLGFYAAGTIFLNGFFGRQVLSLGKPLGLIKKG